MPTLSKVMGDYINAHPREYVDILAEVIGVEGSVPTVSEFDMFVMTCFTEGFQSLAGKARQSKEARQ